MSTEKQTERLVESLAATPVRPWPGTGTLLAGLALLLPLFLAVEVFFIGPEARLGTLRPEFLAENLLLLSGGGLALWGLARFSRPQENALRAGWPVLAALGLWTAGCGFYPAPGAAIFHELHSPLAPCALDVFALSLPPALGIGWLTRRGASTHPLWAGAAALVAVGCLAILASRALCPLEDPAHLLVQHFLPLVPLVVAGAVAGKFFLRW